MSQPGGRPPLPAPAGYFDAASTVPLHPAGRRALLAAVDDGWSDPARLYRSARRARQLLDGARETVAGALGARAAEVSFPSSGTAAAHLAVLGGLSARRRVGRRLVTSAVEHSCILHAADRHAAGGGEAVRVEVDRAGVVDLASFRAALAPDTALASLQSANHEVGTVQPVVEVAEACRRYGVPLHVDAAQSVGRVPVDVSALGVDLLTASAHKWGGPAGVGVLVVRTGTRWRSPLPADDRDGGRVAGFENVPAVLAAAAALEAAVAEMAQEGPRLHALVDRIRAEVLRRVPDVEVAGDAVRRLPHLVAFSCLYVPGEALAGALDAAGFAVSSGSSCTAGTLEPSHVLVAMGVLTSGNVRVSLPAGTAAADVERFLDVVPAVVAELRALAGATGL